ncbi:zinc finger protein 252 isoform X1 [Manduca sexta]|uniref:zinc finger protein 252 isoform X1 n=2 Tax=Manduca sexta TaxID=7130 RepID=UPI0018909B8E|nr:zinc finger protein 252 isoform X1 [Manduca sexta]
MEVFLYNSTVCRLCGEENDNGSLLYSCEDNNQNLSEIINAYLPIKVSDDGELPRTICPGCTIQLEATVEFLTLIINGQKIIRELHQREKEYKKSVLNATVPEEAVAEKIVYEVNTSDGVYQVEHPIALQVAGLEKPKRKRGRPPKKSKSPEELANQAAKQAAKQAAMQAATQQEYLEKKQTEEKDSEPTGKRRRKTPTRFKEAVQGKELERILKEEGVITGDEGKSKKDSDKPKEPEVIGHLEESGELIVVGRGKGRGRPKGRMRPNREQCSICGMQFSCVGRYMSHVAAHGPVVFRCTCGAACGSRLALDHHQRATHHRGHHVVPAHTLQHQPEPDTVEEQLPTITIDQTPPETDAEVSVVDDTPVMDSLPDLNEPTDVSEEQTIVLINTESKEPKQEVQDEFIEEDIDTNSIPNETIVEALADDNVVQEVETTTQGKVKLKCHHCDKTYSSKQSRSLHMKAAHEGLRPFACAECGAQFSYPRSLALHRISHARRKPQPHKPGFACDLCGKVLSHPSSVVYHKEAEHAGQKFVCNKCGKQFKHKQLLQRHQLVHTQHRPFTCKTCNATFKTRPNLMNHQLLHSGVKRYSCEICKHRFAHKTSLTLHMRWHAGMKPYVCKTCGKSFSQKGNLAEHARIHSGEKPFACALCPRRFTTSSQHRLHARRHAERSRRGRRLPRCHPCARAFPTAADLAKHNRLIHGQISLLTSANPPQIIEPTMYEIQTQEDKLSIEEPSEDIEERVIYVAYNMDGTDSPAIHILNSEQEELEEAPKSLSSCSLFGGESLLAAPLSPDPTHHVHPADSPDQLSTHADHMPVTDEQGNPLHFTMQDGTRLAITSADGKSLQVITQDGQTIPVEINGFAEEEEMHNPDTIVHQLNLQKTVDANVSSPVTHFFTIV